MKTQLAKLRLRVKQRLAGTIGICLSMSGYTAPAKKNILAGGQLEVLLFEKQHFEAILHGFISPQNLLELLLDRAHFDGKALVDMIDIGDPHVYSEHFVWAPPARDVDWQDDDVALETIVQVPGLNQLTSCTNDGPSCLIGGYEYHIDKARQTIQPTISIPWSRCISSK